MSSSFDLPQVEARVAEAVSAGAPKDSLRDIYESDLLDWSDAYDEISSADPSSPASAHARQQIAELWFKYGQMEEKVEGDEDRSKEVYEKALNDPFGSLHVGIYTSYAAACASTDPTKARSVYLSGVSSQSKLSEPDQAKLWGAFLDWSNSLNPQGAVLTLDEFRKQVLGEMDVTPPSSDDEDGGRGEAFSAPAESKDDGGEAGAGGRGGVGATEPEPEPSSQLQHAAITPELLIKRHGKRPVMLLSAPHKEHISQGAAGLSEDDVKALEEFMGCSLMQIREKGAWLLDIVEGLWLAQALKEKNLETLFLELKSLHAREDAELERKASNPAFQRAQVQADQKRQQSKSLVQQEVLHAQVNEMLLALLREQFEVLAQIAFPVATMALYEHLETATIASSSKPGPPGSVAELDANLKASMTRLQVMLGSLLSVRLQPTTWDASLAASKNVDPTADPRKRRRA